HTDAAFPAEYSATDGVVNSWLAHPGGIFTRRPGLFIMEATTVFPDGRIRPSDSSLWRQNIDIQLAHAWLKASTLALWLSRGLLAKPDAGDWPDDVWGLLTIAGMRTIVAAVVDAAKRAVRVAWHRFPERVRRCRPRAEDRAAERVSGTILQRWEEGSQRQDIGWHDGRHHDGYHVQQILEADQADVALWGRSTYHSSSICNERLLFLSTALTIEIPFSVDDMSVFDIFGAIGTALAILALIHNRIKGKLPQSRTRRLLDLISQTEEYQGIIREDELIQRLHPRIAGQCQHLLERCRNDAEDLQHECRRAGNSLLQQYHFMLTGRTREIEELATHVEELSCVLSLYSMKQNHWEKQLIILPGAAQRLHMKQKFVLKMRRVLKAQKEYVDEAIDIHGK
ncbi:hypothetical protein EVG20_g4764, partial [Dentipellis fragilis]